MGDLASGVYAGVGPSGADQLGRLIQSQNSRDPALQLALHGAPSGLDGPAGEVRPVVAMSSRQRTLDGSASSADTAIGKVEDLTSRVQPALLEVGDRPSVPPRPAVGMQVAEARIAIQNLPHPPA